MTRSLSFFESPLLRVSPFALEATKGVEPLSTGLQDRRSVIHLSYIARKFSIVDFRMPIERNLTKNTIENWQSEIENVFGGPGRDSNPRVQFAGLPCSQLHHPPEEFSIFNFRLPICETPISAKSTIGNRQSTIPFGGYGWI